MFGNNLSSFIERKGVEFLSYTNADIRNLEDIDIHRGFHIIRDPRDIVVSAYFSHKYSHPTRQAQELVPLRKKLHEASLEEGLFIEIDFLQHIFEQIYSWDYRRENILEMKMEDLIADPYEKFIDIFSFLGLVSGESPNFVSQLKDKVKNMARLGNSVGSASSNSRKLAVKDFLYHVYENRFSKKSGGRNQGQENIENHYRKGTSGDWVNYFKDEHKEHFKEKYGDFLVKLEYEEDGSW